MRYFLAKEKKFLAHLCGFRSLGFEVRVEMLVSLFVGGTPRPWLVTGTDAHLDGCAETQDQEKEKPRKKTKPECRGTRRAQRLNQQLAGEYDTQKLARRLTASSEATHLHAVHFVFAHNLDGDPVRVGALEIPGAVDVAEGAIAHLFKKLPPLEAGIFGEL